VSESLLGDAFAHHVATVRLIDACQALSSQQLGTTVPGTYGSTLETQRHLVGSDSFYLFIASGECTPLLEEEGMDLTQLRSATEGQGALWARLLGEDPDPNALVNEVDDEDEKLAPMGIRLAQALHHGTDHRSQICTALTTLGVEPASRTAASSRPHPPPDETLLAPSPPALRRRLCTPHRGPPS
jgi:uncharacterized damage-inducible protein DinB